MERWGDYDIHDEKSVLKHASRLTKKTLRDIIGTCDIDVRGGTNSKGIFGQAVEKGYFHIENNNRHEADFADLGIELKTHPMIENKTGGFVAKERLVLGIINYIRADEDGFDTFTRKNSHILLLFYRWVPDTPIFDYRFLKVVNWVPSSAELQMIREDWDVIHEFIHNGRAHLLSERFTKVLAANTKGSGGERDLRKQPHSDILAKQRSLSFKTSFMTMLYNSNPDIGMRYDKTSGKYEEIFKGPWEDGTSFESAILSRLQKYVGHTCHDIEHILGICLNPDSKQYYRTLINNMMGAHGKKDVKELMEAGISMKTMRIRLNGLPKESMSFPYFRYEDIATGDWENSDFIQQIDHRFFFPVFGFLTERPNDEKDRKALVFRGAFFWSMPDDVFSMAKDVWNDTKEKILDGHFDDFIHKSTHPVYHIRTHGKDGADLDYYDGKGYPKRCFWINDTYLMKVISESLYGEHSTRM